MITLESQRITPDGLTRALFGYNMAFIDGRLTLRLEYILHQSRTLKRHRWTITTGAWSPYRSRPGGFALLNVALIPRYEPGEEVKQEILEQFKKLLCFN